MNKMQKLWVATELFHPDQTSTSFILTKIVNSLSEKYSISVLCGPLANDFNIDEHFYLSENVNVNRLGSNRNTKSNLKKRALQSVWLSLKIFFKLLQSAKKNDKVFIVSNPVSLILVVALAKKIKNFHLTILVHDVFPENAIPAKILSSEKTWIFKTLKLIFDWSYSSANQLIVLGRDMESVIQSKIHKHNTATNIKIIENWGDVENITPNPKNSVLEIDSPLLNKIVFQYAGNLGRVQGLMELLENFIKINNEKISFQFIGDGTVKNEMKEYIKKNHIENVYFANSFQRNEQNKILNSADVAIITLASGMLGLGVPSKFYNILAAGKPIVYIGDSKSEISLLINNYDIGYSFEPKDKNGIIDFFNNINDEFIEDIKVKSNNARNLAITHYSEEIIINKFLNTI